MTLERGTGIDGERNGDGARDHAARAATLRVIERHGAQVMRTARRYALTPEDAEDAYQRAVEIMLTKAPAIPDADLLPWLKTVVKHEAFALRRQGERSARAADGSLDGASDTEAAIASPAPSPIEQSERFERLRLGAEAMRHLKPQEIRALTLLAQGYTYRQICDETGWTYTKVNRCLAEGRQSFLQRVAGIESGDECRRLEPKLSALADGEAAEEELAGLRRHLRRCLACRATFREQYLAPGIVGALAPSALLGGGAKLFERLHELVATFKVKAASVARLPGVDGGGGAAHPTLSDAGRLASAGLAKGLAVLAVGGAGVGGVVAGAERLMDSTRPESADAATRQQEGDARASRMPRSSDPRLVAERLGRSEQGLEMAGEDPRVEPRGAGAVDTARARAEGHAAASEAAVAETTPSAWRPGSTKRHRLGSERPQPRITPPGDHDGRSSPQREDGYRQPCEQQWGGFSGDESKPPSCSEQAECVDPSVAASSGETDAVVCSRQEGCVDPSVAAASGETDAVVCSTERRAGQPDGTSDR